MNGTEMAITAVYLGLTLLIIGVFGYRIRQGTFKKHITAQAAIVISFVIITMVVKDMPLIVRLTAVAGVASLFSHGRQKSKESS